MRFKNRSIQFKEPIKPFQRLYILKVHLLPSLVHKLIFDEVSLGSLNSADTSIRGATRHWLHLPNDVPKPFYHVPVNSGGLGILQLRQWFPRLRMRRLTEIFSEIGRRKDEFMTDVLRGNTLIMREFRKYGTAEAKQSKQDWKEAVSESFYKTVDGYRLRSFTKGVGMSEWISAAVPRIPSGQYIGCMKVRAAALQCSRYERHNVVMRRLENELIERGFKTKKRAPNPCRTGT